MKESVYANVELEKEVSWFLKAFIFHRTGKLYHLLLRVECTLFCNLQSQARTHAILVIGLYELLDNPTT
jgi:hypothetical protein